MTEPVKAGDRIRLMIPAGRHFNLRLPQTAAFAVLVIALLFSAAISGWAVKRVSGAAVIPAPASSPVKTQWVTPELPPVLDGDVFSGGAPGSSMPFGELAKRFRLAGTFFVASDAGEDSRRAVLHDSKDQSQRVVAEGDAIGDVSVVSIYQDHVVLRRLGVEEELWLGFWRQDRSPAGTNATRGASSVAASGGAVDMFGGRKIGQNRWVFDRDSLMSYYRTLTDNPERLVAVFDSLKPVYNSDRRIQGYRLGVEGEKEFFGAVGLREGDVVRKANSLEMSSRRRAEFLIQQFVDGKSNAYVLDIDRDGQDVRLVYEIR